MRIRFSQCCSLALLCALAQDAHAGFYGGYESDGEGGGIAYLGMQGGGEVVYEVFLADLDYRYIDRGSTVSANQKIVAPAAGLRWNGDWRTTVMIGPSFVDKTERSALRPRRESEKVGGLAKLAVNSTAPGIETELLASYATIDHFLWSRVRLRHWLNGALAAGGDVFWMGGDDADSYGAGLLLGLRGRLGSVTVKYGYQRASNDRDTQYAGVEAAILF
jgi:hypothetical protein